jgi:hypothetical protein
MNNIHVMDQKTAKILGLHPYLGIAFSFWLITWQFFAQFQKERYSSAQETSSYKYRTYKLAGSDLV